MYKHIFPKTFFNPDKSDRTCYSFHIRRYSNSDQYQQLLCILIQHVLVRWT